MDYFLFIDSKKKNEEFFLWVYRLIYMILFFWMDTKVYDFKNKSVLLDKVFEFDSLQSVEKVTKRGQTYFYLQTLTYEGYQIFEV